MDNLKTAETCDECGKPIEILIADLERAMKDDLQVLCPRCNTIMLNEQAEAEKLPDVCFKYKMISTEDSFDELGLDGWELVAVSDGQAYFKISYFREAE